MSPEKKMVIDGMLDHFSSIWPVKNLEEKKESYSLALQRYPMEKIREAGIRCLGANKFPVPAEIIEKMSLTEYTKEDYRISYNMRCRICNRIGLGIEEPIGSKNWRCRRCYTGLTDAEIKGRFNDLFRMMDQPGYRPEWVKQIEEG